VFSKREIILAAFANKCKVKATIIRSTPQEAALADVPVDEQPEALAVLEVGLDLLERANLIYGPRHATPTPPLMASNSILISAGYHDGKPVFRRVWLKSRAKLTPAHTK
jgi:hypothetical protein